MSNEKIQGQWVIGESIVEGSTDSAHIIVEIEQAESPLSKSYAPVFFKTIQLLLLENGSEAYACTECRFVSPKVGVVRFHGRTDHPKPGQAHPKSVRMGRSPESMTVAELLETAEEVTELRETVRKLRTKLERIETNDSDWKRRALAAEKDLNTLRQALRGAMGDK